MTRTIATTRLATASRPGTPGSSLASPATPAGGKKGARGLSKDLDRALARKLTLRINGKDFKGTAQELMLRTLAMKAAGGDDKASKQLTQLTIACFGVEDRGGGKEKLSPDDNALLEELLQDFEQADSDGSSPTDPGDGGSQAERPGDDDN